MTQEREEYRKEIAALKLLHPDYDLMDDNRKTGLHNMFQWSVSAAVEVGLVVWTSQIAQGIQQPEGEEV